MKILERENRKTEKKQKQKITKIFDRLDNLDLKLANGIEHANCLTEELFKLRQISSEENARRNGIVRNSWSPRKRQPLGKSFNLISTINK